MAWGQDDEVSIVTTDKDSHFTGALAQNAKEDESIVVDLKDDRCVIVSIALQSDENLAWDVFFWKTSEFDNTNLDDDDFIGYVSFAAADGVRIGGAGQYYYSKDSLAIPYVDEGDASKLHVSLVCRSAAGKTAGAAGEVVIRFGIVT